MKQIFAIVVVALSLQGCFFVAGAAAGAAGIAVVYDHRKLEQISRDQQIANSIYATILTYPKQKANSHIAVTCYNQVVLLTGQTISAELRQQAEEIAQRTNGVKRVVNDVAIKGPSSSLTRASDSWITTKIRTQMLATKGLKSGSIKVLTENGTVYLLGVVTHEQGEIAIDIARQVAGVQKVVKIFQFND